MSSTDWTFISDALASGSVDRAPTAGIARPNGGGQFVYGMNSLNTNPGVVALFTNQVGFAPMAKGCSVRGCVQRGPSGGPTGWAPFLFCCLQGTTSAAVAYMLGLSDNDPHRILLRKGAISGGLPDLAVASPPNSGVLAKSVATFSLGTWLHLRLDAILNGNGDVVLNVFQNDLTANPCTAPVWAAVPGLSQFIDDAIGVNTGSVPLVGGYAGFGGQFANVTRRAFFDQIEVQAQQ